MNKRIAIIIIAVLLLAIAGAIAYFGPKNMDGTGTWQGGWSKDKNADDTNNGGSTGTSSSTEAAVRDVVTKFGLGMKSVPLGGSNDASVVAMQQYYGPYVSAELLANWQKGLLEAPGRSTSSPWPDHIVITNVIKASTTSYIVVGKVVELTSLESEQGGAAAMFPVQITVEKQSVGWRITKYEPGAHEPTSYQLMVRGDYTCLPKKTDSAPSTLECANGIKGDDGNYYALDMSKANQGTAVPALTSGDRMEVAGTFVPVELISAAQFQTYDIKGIIMVTSVKTL